MESTSEGTGRKGLMMPIPLTISHLIDRVERYFPTVEVVSRLVDNSVSRSTYGATMARARRLAGALREEGLRPGDRVATLLWNHGTNFETYFGVPLARGILVPLNFRLPPSELEFILTQSQPRWLIVEDLLWPVFETIRHAATSAKVRLVGPTRPAAADAAHDYDEWIAGAPAVPSSLEIDENEGTALFYTTGTTGRSKGVLYSHRSTILHTLVFALTFELSHRDVLASIIPMSHTNGAGMPHSPPLLGAKVVFAGPQPNAIALLDLFEREGVTFTGAVPRTAGEILEALERNPGRWRLAPGFRFLSGGSAVPESMIRRFDRLGVRVLQLWGMTETSPLATISIPKAHLSHLPEDQVYALRARQGFPVPFVDVRTRPSSGLRLRGDPTEGELEVRGPYVAAAYYEQPGRSERWTADGWFRTGDVAVIDAEGYVRICDRIGDLVKIGDEWASSQEVEEALGDHPGVREVAVVPIVGLHGGECPHAVVVARDGTDPRVDELDHFLRGRIPDDWHPASYSFVSALPKTGVGKTAKQVLRQQLASGAIPIVRVADAPTPRT